MVELRELTKAELVDQRTKVESGALWLEAETGDLADPLSVGVRTDWFMGLESRGRSRPINLIFRPIR